jgi:hypothetical protein
LDQIAKEAGQHTRPRDKYIGVYIGILAVILAVCSLGGGNANQDATLKNIEASNTWAFFQAKNLRRQSIRLQIDDFEAILTANPALGDDAKKQMQAKIADYHAQEKKLTSDPERKEGLDELFTKGKALEVERDDALKRGPYFDYGQVMLQIAIVLASVALISGGSALLMVSFLSGLIGAALTIGGFTLAFPLSFFT